MTIQPVRCSRTSQICPSDGSGGLEDLRGPGFPSHSASRGECHRAAVTPRPSSLSLAPLAESLSLSRYGDPSTRTLPASELHQTDAVYGKHGAQRSLFIRPAAEINNEKRADEGSAAGRTTHRRRVFHLCPQRQSIASSFTSAKPSADQRRFGFHQRAATSAALNHPRSSTFRFQLHLSVARAPWRGHGEAMIPHFRLSEV